MTLLPHLIVSQPYQIKTRRVCVHTSFVKGGVMRTVFEGFCRLKEGSEWFIKALGDVYYEYFTANEVVGVSCLQGFEIRLNTFHALTDYSAA